MEMFFRKVEFPMKGKEFPAAHTARNINEVEKFLVFINNTLGVTKYFAGNEPNIVDIMLFFMLEDFILCSEEIPAKYENVHRFIADVAKIPAVAEYSEEFKAAFKKFQEESAKKE